MLAAERRKYILEILKRDGRIVAPALSAELGVSEDTIRRDLRELASEGRLQRVHGGALPTSPATDSYQDRQRRLGPGAISIAQRAAEQVQSGMLVLIGGGTTNVQVAHHLPYDLRATIATHNPPVAMALADHPNVEVILLGGKLYSHSMVTVGPATIQAVRMLRADLCLLGVCSLHPEIGVSTTCLDEVYVQQAMIASSAEVAALAGAEKLGTAAPYIVGPLSDLNLLITDESASEEMLAPYRQVGIEVLQGRRE